MQGFPEAHEDISEEQNIRLEIHKHVILENLTFQSRIDFEGMLVVLLRAVFLSQGAVEVIQRWQPFVLELLEGVQPFVRKEALLADQVQVIWEVLPNTVKIIELILLVVSVFRELL